MTFPQSISTVFRKYAEFNGVATRPEFWWWILFTPFLTDPDALAKDIEAAASR